MSERPFKLRSGNKTSFKSMGSSPAKTHTSGIPHSESGYKKGDGTSKNLVKKVKKKIFSKGTKETEEYKGHKGTRSDLSGKSGGTHDYKEVTHMSKEKTDKYGNVYRAPKRSKATWTSTDKHGNKSKFKTKGKYTDDPDGAIHGRTTKVVETGGGRRRVTKYDKQGNPKKTTDRRTLKGFLTGKGKK